MSHLVYLANLRVPSEKAHSLQVFKSCEAFAGRGWSVTLVHPRRRRTDAMEGVDNVFDFYQVEDRFALEEIRSPDLLRFPMPASLHAMSNFLQSSLFAVLAASRYGPREDAMLYTTDFFVATALALLRRRFVLELHTLPERGPLRRWMRLIDRQVLATIVITRQLAEDCVALGATRERILVAADAVDRARLGADIGKERAREELGVPHARPVAAYTGHLYRWKGVETILHCAKQCPEVSFLVVGGTEEDVRRARQEAETQELGNLRLEGYVLPARVPLYLAAADVLLLPNSGRYTISARHTSPMKLFEYMAARRPVVASALPSLGEVLHHERNALCVPPDDPAALATAIRRVLEKPELGRRLAEEAFRDVSSRTWDGRAAIISDFLAERRD